MTKPNTEQTDSDLLAVVDPTVQRALKTAIASGSLFECAHCNGSGTCATGREGASCDACAKDLNFFGSKERFGLACHTCRGLGKTTTHLHKLQQKATPYLAYTITGCSFALILLFGAWGYWRDDAKIDYFNEVMAFCTTLLGAVTGYYFSSRNSRSDST